MSSSSEKAILEKGSWEIGRSCNFFEARQAEGQKSRIMNSIDCLANACNLCFGQNDLLLSTLRSCMWNVMKFFVRVLEASLVLPLDYTFWLYCLRFQFSFPNSRLYFQAKIPWSLIIEAKLLVKLLVSWNLISWITNFQKGAQLALTSRKSTMETSEQCVKSPRG